MTFKTPRDLQSTCLRRLVVGIEAAALFYLRGQQGPRPEPGLEPGPLRGVDQARGKVVQVDIIRLTLGSKHLAFNVSTS